MIRNFNTSHVVVYPIIYDSSEERYFYFNTSHVVVYPERECWRLQGYTEFQYISCCSLSADRICCR